MKRCQKTYVQKISTIINILKLEKPKIANEYRPINILPTYEKILEIAVKELEKYIDIILY